MATAISSLYAELKLEAENFNNGLKAAAKEADQFEKTIRPSINAAKELGETMSIIGDVVAGAMIEMTIKSAEYGAALEHLHERSGVSIEDLGALGFAAEQNGSSLEGLGNSLKFLSKNLELASEGSKGQVAAFAALGISHQDIVGTGGSASAMFAILADRISGMEDPSVHAADFTKVLGKSWVELVPTLKLGSDGLAEARDQAERLGLILDESTAAADLKFEQSLKQVTQALQGVANSVGADLMPILQPLVDDLVSLEVAAGRAAKGHEYLTDAVFLAAAAIGGTGGLLLGLAGLGLAYPAIMGGLDLVKGAFEGLSTAATATTAKVAVLGDAMALLSTVGTVTLGVEIGYIVGKVINAGVAQAGYTSELDKTIRTITDMIPTLGSYVTGTDAVNDAAAMDLQAHVDLEKALRSTGLAVDNTRLGNAAYVKSLADAMLAAKAFITVQKDSADSDARTAEMIFEWQQANTAAMNAGFAWQKQLEAHVQTVQKFMDTVVPSAGAVWDLKGKLEAMTAAGIPAATITATLGKEAETMAQKFSQAGIDAAAAMGSEATAVLGAYEISKATNDLKISQIHLVTGEKNTATQAEMQLARDQWKSETDLDGNQTGYALMNMNLKLAGQLSTIGAWGQAQESATGLVMQLDEKETNAHIKELQIRESWDLENLKTDTEFSKSKVQVATEARARMAALTAAGVSAESDAANQKVLDVVNANYAVMAATDKAAQAGIAAAHSVATEWQKSMNQLDQSVSNSLANDVVNWFAVSDQLAAKRQRVEDQITNLTRQAELERLQAVVNSAIAGSDARAIAESNLSVYKQSIAAQDSAARAAELAKLQDSLDTVGSHWHAILDDMESITKHAAQSMLSAFLDGMIKPFTNALAGIGASITDTILGINSANGQLSGLAGMAHGLESQIAGLFSRTSGLAEATAAQATHQMFAPAAELAGAGGSAAAAGSAGSAGAGGSTGIMGFLGSSAGIATLGIGAGVAGVIALLKSQAHWEANTFVNEIQAPVGDELASIVAAVNNAYANGTLTSAAANDAAQQLVNVAAQFDQTANQFGAGGGDKRTVAEQGRSTIDPLVGHLISDIYAKSDALQQQAQAPAVPAWYVQHVGDVAASDIGQADGNVGAFYGELLAGLTPASSGWDHNLDYLYGGLGRVPGFADGLWSVPYDNFIGRLHQDEIVLPKAAADAYRAGGGGTQITIAPVIQIAFSGNAGSAEDRQSLVDQLIDMFETNNGGVMETVTTQVKRMLPGIVTA